MNDNSALAQTAEPPIEVVPLTADEIRSRIVSQFKAFEPHAVAYHDYAERISALSVQYHDLRLKESFNLPIDEMVLLTTLDARETPKGLDTKLATLLSIPDTKIKRIIFDRVKGCYHIFV